MPIAASLTGTLERNNATVRGVSIGRTMRLSTCHPEREFHAKGLCPPCYHAAYNASTVRRAADAARRKTHRAALAAYHRSPRAIALRHLRESTPRHKAARAARQATPEYKAAKAVRRARPEARARQIAYDASPKRKAAVSARSIARRKSDILYRLACNLRTRLYLALRNRYKAGSAVRGLGCPIDHLKMHLELFWDDGMSWENYGHHAGQWSIDHIRPLAAFDLTDEGQCSKASHYLNLQPLWQTDNRRKSDIVEVN